MRGKRGLSSAELYPLLRGQTPVTMTKRARLSYPPVSRHDSILGFLSRMLAGFSRRLGGCFPGCLFRTRGRWNSGACTPRFTQPNGDCLLRILYFLPTLARFELPLLKLVHGLLHRAFDDLLGLAFLLCQLSVSLFKECLGRSRKLKASVQAFRAKRSRLIRCTSEPTTSDSSVAPNAR